MRLRRLLIIGSLWGVGCSLSHSPDLPRWGGDGDGDGGLGASAGDGDSVVGDGDAIGTGGTAAHTGGADQTGVGVGGETVEGQKPGAVENLGGQGGQP